MAKQYVSMGQFNTDRKYEVPVFRNEAPGVMVIPERRKGCR